MGTLRLVIPRINAAILAGVCGASSLMHATPRDFPYDPEHQFDGHVDFGGGGMVLHDDRDGNPLETLLERHERSPPRGSYAP